MVRPSLFADLQGALYERAFAEAPKTYCVASGRTEDGGFRWRVCWLPEVEPGEMIATTLWFNGAEFIIDRRTCPAMGVAVRQ